MVQSNIFDICQSRHGGNQNSVIAFRAVAPRLTEQREAVLNAIRSAGLNGATNKSIAQLLNTGINNVSGRRTELLRDELIWETGERRNGCGVVIVTELREEWKAMNAMKEAA